MHYRTELRHGEEADDMATKNEKVIQRLIKCINERKVEVMDELFHDDAVMDWPQSGERIIGAANRRAIYGAFPALPTITPRRMVSEGDLVVAEASLDYGGPSPYKAVFIFEFRDGKIAKETAYWSEPFEAPDWRSQWVEKVD
jgi:ketosteroid isomerase-like protein